MVFADVFAAGCNFNVVFAEVFAAGAFCLDLAGADDGVLELTEAGAQVGCVEGGGFNWFFEVDRLDGGAC